MTHRKTIAGLLKDARFQSGLTIEELSRTSGVSVQNLTSLEKGSVEHFYSVDSCRKMAFAYAQILNIEQQVEQLWADADWMPNSDMLGAYPLGADSRTPALLPSKSGVRRKLNLPPRVYAAGLIALYTLIIAAAFWRLNDPDPLSEDLAALAGALGSGGAIEQSLETETKNESNEKAAPKPALLPPETQRAAPVASAAVLEQLANQKAVLEKALSGARAEKDQIAGEKRVLEQTVLAEKTAREKLVSEKAALEKLVAAEKANTEKSLIAERAAREKLVSEKAALEKLVAAEKASSGKALAAEKANLEKTLAAEKAAREKLVAEKAALEKLVAAEKANSEKSLIAARAAREKLVSEKAALEKLVAAEKANSGKALAAEKANLQKNLAAEKAAREKLIADRAATDKLVAEKASADKLALAAAAKASAAEQAAANKVAANKVAADKVTVAAANTLRTAVEARLTEFAALWSARRVEPYLALFDPSFPNIASYAENRRKRMLAASFIEVAISNVSYQETAPGEITTRFTQRYRSDQFQSQETKELVWRQTPSGPRIVLERKLR